MRAMVMVLLLAGCATGGDVAALRAGEWRLVSVEGFSTIPAGVEVPTLRFDADGNVGGNTGCNMAGGTYETSGSKLTIGQMSSTMRACLAPEGNELEAAFVRALGNTREYRVTAETLELLSADGAVLARLASSR